MANNLTKNPWVIDTVGDLDDVGTYRVPGIRWVAPNAAAGQIVKLTDASSRTFWSTVASGGNYVEADRITVRSQHPVGLRLEQMGTGTMYIEFL